MYIIYKYILILLKVFLFNMATNPPSNLSLNGYWDVSPDVLIKDLRGWLFSFPTGTYNNGSGGDVKSASDSYTYANGRYFGSGISSNAGNLNGEPWSSTKKVNDSNYSDNQGSSISPNRDDNANSYEKITTLNNHTTPPGYDKKSNGSGDNKGLDTSNYLIANVDNFNNFHFSVYTKKQNRKDFLNDLIANAPSDKKTVLRQMAAKDCSNGNQRWNADGTGVGTDFCEVACDGNTDTKDVCYNGNAQWCRDNTVRIARNYDSAVSAQTNTKCVQPLKDGRFDDTIRGLCKTTTNIGTPLCNDIRTNSGSTAMKNELEKYLYGTICASDSNISNAACSDVRTTCNDTAQLLADNEPYNCRTLVKNLNEDANIITMTSKMDLSKVPVDKRTEMLEYFNKRATNKVEDALCSIASNASDTACQTYLKNNFSNLVKTDATKPILIMYFTGGTVFNTKAGMDSWNNFKITFRADGNGKVGLTTLPQITLGAQWSAKLYTYITPSTTTDYMFKASADDLCKVYLNNNLIINAWDNIASGTNVYSPYITLDPSKGPYLLYVEYGDNGGGAALNVDYTTKALVGTGAISAAVYSGMLVLPAGAPVVGTSPITGNGVVANTLYMSSFNPYNLTLDNRKTQSIVYCSTGSKFATDTKCKGTASDSYKAINATYITSDNVFKKAMVDYCGTGSNFSTDAFCIGDATLANNYSNGINKNISAYDSSNTSINTAIDTFCKNERNNTYATAGAQWCKKNDNINNLNYSKPASQSLHPEYAKTLRETRLKYIRDAISTSIRTGGALSQDVIDYITTDYVTLQTNGTKALFPDSNIVTPELTSFCENSDAPLKTNLCNNVYATYKDNQTIKSSKARIDDFANCIENKAFMGKSNNAEYNTSCMAKRDAPATYARYLPLAIQYCGAGDNIVSPECTTYYNNIQSNINNAMNANYTNAANNPTRSSFSNKESFKGGNCEDQYDDNDENANECGSCNENSDYTFLFILFICFVLVLCCFSSYSNSKCQKNKHHHDQIQITTAVKEEK